MSNKPTLWAVPEPPEESFDGSTYEQHEAWQDGWQSGYGSCLTSPELANLVKERDAMESALTIISMLSDYTAGNLQFAKLKAEEVLSTLHPTQAKDE